MDFTVPLVIRITGLLLFAPHTPAGNQLPVHVLMPQTSGTTVHHAQLGFRAPNAPECAWHQHGICYVSLAGRSLEIGSHVPGTAGGVPPGASHVSNASGRRVLAHLLGPQPGTSVLRSRITLNEGMVTDTCAMANWSFGGSIRPLANVVQWTIQGVPNAPMVLALKRLDTGATDTTVTVTVTPATGIMELYIRHVTTREQDHRFAGLAPALHDPAPHFHELYKLFGPPEDQTPAPLYWGTLNRRCGWVLDPESGLPVRSPGTVSCMVGSGLPG